GGGLHGDRTPHGGGRGGPRRGQGPMGRHVMKIFSEQHDMFRQSVRAFVEKEVEPHIEEWEQAGQIPRSIWTRMGELGFLGVEYDERYGGAGADFLTTMVLCEEMARSRSRSPALAGGVATDNASPPLYLAGGGGPQARHHSR